MLKELNQFPNFRPITFEDMDWYNDFYANFQPYADHYFGNLLAWLNFHHDLSIAEINNNVIFRYTDVFDPSKKDFSYTLLGKDSPSDTLKTFYSQESMNTAEIAMVPEHFATELDTSDFEIVEDRDDWDYIYSIPSFVALEGPDYRRVRYQIRTFEKEQSDKSSFGEFQVKEEHGRKILFDSFRHWENSYQYGNDPEEIETHALQCRFENYLKIPFRVFALNVDKKIAGFVLFSYPPQQEFAIIHHLKCNYTYEHMFDYIFYSSLKIFQQEGKTLLNLEQDLGIPGLRHHKELLRPERFLKKYTVRQK